MLDLIKQIENAWSDRTTLLNVDPYKCNGYFDFRNQVVLRHNRKERGVA